MFPNQVLGHLASFLCCFYNIAKCICRQFSLSLFVFFWVVVFLSLGSSLFGSNATKSTGLFGSTQAGSSLFGQTSAANTASFGGETNKLFDI